MRGKAKTGFKLSKKRLQAGVLNKTDLKDHRRLDAQKKKIQRIKRKSGREWIAAVRQALAES